MLKINVCRNVKKNYFCIHKFVSRKLKYIFCFFYAENIKNLENVEIIKSIENVVQKIKNNLLKNKIIDEISGK